MLLVVLEGINKITNNNNKFNTSIYVLCRLVVSFFTTVANYEYGFYWYLYLDGSIHFEVNNKQ